MRHSGTVHGYRPVEVAVKETTTIGWICLPDQAAPEGWSRLVDQQAARLAVRRSLADVETLLSLSSAGNRQISLWLCRTHTGLCWDGQSWPKTKL